MSSLNRVAVAGQCCTPRVFESPRMSKTARRKQPEQRNSSFHEFVTGPERSIGHVLQFGQVGSAGSAGNDIADFVPLDQRDGPGWCLTGV